MSGYPWGPMKPIEWDKPVPAGIYFDGLRSYINDELEGKLSAAEWSAVITQIESWVFHYHLVPNYDETLLLNRALLRRPAGSPAFRLYTHRVSQGEQMIRTVIDIQMNHPELFLTNRQ